VTTVGSIMFSKYPKTHNTTLIIS